MGRGAGKPKTSDIGFGVRRGENRDVGLGLGLGLGLGKSKRRDAREAHG